jgi:hypothetical protein
MDIENIEKKLREARFFVEKMREREAMAFGDREPFDFCLSAFLSAARTARYALRDEGHSNWKTSGWDAKLDVRQKALVKFFVDERNDQVHEIGSSHVPSMVNVPILGGGGFRREVQPRRQHWFLNEKAGFPFRTPAFCSVFQGTKTARREGISSPFSDAGGCTSPQNSGGRHVAHGPEQRVLGEGGVVVESD